MSFRGVLHYRIAFSKLAAPQESLERSLDIHGEPYLAQFAGVPAVMPQIAHSQAVGRLDYFRVDQGNTLQKFAQAPCAP